TKEIVATPGLRGRLSWRVEPVAQRPAGSEKRNVLVGNRNDHAGARVVAGTGVTALHRKMSQSSAAQHGLGLKRRTRSRSASVRQDAQVVEGQPSRDGPRRP